MKAISTPANSLSVAMHSESALTRSNRLDNQSAARHTQRAQLYDTNILVNGGMLSNVRSQFTVFGI